MTNERELRILLAIESSSGGSGRHVIDLAIELLRLGHSVHIAYAEPRIDQRFKVGIQRVIATGGKATIMPFPFKIGFRDLVAAYAFRKLAQREGKFDIIHLHSSKAGAIGRIGNAGLRTKVVYTPHLLRTASPGLSTRSAFVYRIMEKILDRGSDVTICVSSFEQHHALKQGLPAAKLTTIENGIEAEGAGDRKKLRKDLGVAPDSVVIGFVGRLVIQKDPLHLLKSFANLTGVPLPHLVVAGDGPLMESGKLIAQELNISDRTHWLGSVDGPMWMAAMDIFVLPSESESFAYTLLEAASNRLPIVTTDTGASGEFVLNEMTGFVVPIKDEIALTQALQRLVDDAELRTTMGEAGHARMPDYSARRMAERTVALYRGLLLNSK